MADAARFILTPPIVMAVLLTLIGGSASLWRRRLGKPVENDSDDIAQLGWAEMPGETLHDRNNRTEGQ
jgi:hypothetical protein